MNQNKIKNKDICIKQEAFQWLTSMEDNWLYNVSLAMLYFKPYYES